MPKNLTERDWKYLNSIKPELRETLCGRINREIAQIAQDSGLSEHEKYHSIHEHLRDASEHVSLCFDDWRRSTLWMRVIALVARDI